MAVPMVLYKGLPKPHSWCRYMVGRTMRKNNNNLISVIGKTGSGKTWAAISICELMSKMDGVPFGIDNIVFSLTDLMRLINSGKLKRGSKIIFDEPQASISAKEFQSVANKVFNLLVTTFRHRNLTLFFCTPYESLLDKSTRKLFHGRFETLSINPNQKTCRLKPLFLEYSDWKPEPYKKRLVVLFKDKKGMRQDEKVSYWDVPKPNLDLIEEYEDKKLEFTTNLNKNIMRKLEEFDESGKGMTSTSKEPEKHRTPLTDKQQLAMSTIANITEENKLERTAEIMGVSIGAISQHKKLAEKKGYTLQEFKR